MVGFNPSNKLVDMAAAQEEGGSVITYFVGDVFSINQSVGEYDYVMGIFLLHYSDRVEQLERMFKIAFQRLQLGGTFLVINDNVSLDKPNVKSGYYHKYNVETVFASLFLMDQGLTLRCLMVMVR